ncbi:hypothetical protein J3B02_003711 [Coemansia erecta]|nr:hypothetical protein J3B02_003711 [Coemansia erecta]
MLVVNAAPVDSEQGTSLAQIPSSESIPTNKMPLIPDEDSLDFEDRMKLYRFLDSVGKLTQ